MATSKITLGEAKNIVNFIIDSNIKYEEERVPVSVCLTAEAGIGKTSLLQQIAKERNMTCTKLSLHELEEAGDLLGYPHTEYECQVAKKVIENGEAKMVVVPGEVWLTAKQLDSKTSNLMYRQTGKTRMAYSKPAWVPEYNDNGNLFILDDFGRCNQTLIQAVMELIYTQGYISWKLPKRTTIVLTSNPDDGQYNISSLDEAQSTRYLNFNIKLDRDIWAKWAEEANIDGRCINFALSYFDELFKYDEDGNRIANPRSFVMFANLISGIKDWDKDIAFIHTLAKGCFNTENNKVGAMFTSYLKHKMHLIIQPKEILNESWETVKNKLEAIIYDGENFRPDLSTLICKRLTNYIIYKTKDDTDKCPINKIIDRIKDFIDYEDSGKVLFTKDLFYSMINTIVNEGNKRQTNKLILDPKIAMRIS